MPKVEFEREGIVAEAQPGQTLLDVAEAAGIDVFRGLWPDLHCGRRRGWCNRCKVWVRPADGGSADALNPPTAKEQARLRLNGRVGGDLRLACQVQPRGDLRVHTRAGGPAPRPTLAAGGPAWKNALSQKPAAEPSAKPPAAGPGASAVTPSGGETK